MHPSLGLPIDEVQVDVVETSRAVAFSGSSPLQEYIDKACSTTCPPRSIIGREAGFIGCILLVDRAEHQELSMDQYTLVDILLAQVSIN